MKKRSLKTTFVRTALLTLLAAAVLPVGLGAEREKTAPTINLLLDGDLGENGWYLGNTTVGWSYSDPVGIKRTVGCDANTVETETKGTEFRCTVTNMDDITVSSSVLIKVDKRPPAVKPRGARPPDANGWFNHRIRIVPGATDTASGIAWCTRTPTYGGPDRRRIRVVVRCRDRAGRTARGRLTFKYDETPPRNVRGVKSRPPDRYGWYARNLSIRFLGGDALSGIDSCARRTYRGPDTARARVRAGCRDRAGNVKRKTVRFRFSKPLLVPASGRTVQAPPVLDWVRVPNAGRYNIQLWNDGRKILSRWPRRTRLDLDRTWRYAGNVRALRRGETYTWYVWPRFSSGYGQLLGQSRFTFRRDAPEPVAAVDSIPAPDGL